MLDEFVLTAEYDQYKLTASVRRIGRDMLVAIWGGGKPHIGAVAMAQPRPSLKDPHILSATASVFTYVGHKEDALVKTCAETLAAALNANVVVSAGAHWDNLPPEGVHHVMECNKLLIERILEKTVQPLAE